VTLPEVTSPEVTWKEVPSELVPYLPIVVGVVERR